MLIKKKVLMCLGVTLICGSISFPFLANSGGFKESTDRNTTYIDHSPYKLMDQKKKALS
ncbi:phosphatase RapH inhibitor [Bacillus inaquosorum]|uniref:phosphatase RapH inhibitor n=1 Tax=Bacillus inaquosorum TaxID=483913 RepID=UPI000A1004B0|nr:phosphatase RapH inhibitor [Bacillus inaquosorum]ARV45152.1 phosphatase RapH inhibitor [Bacillus subtilis]MEC2065420.1 phosphatase RapH inhibitor [Bacillus inaquosorum]MEC2083130.1 phosphatase RapH inhibitor [Bacillus inaquosorum]QJC87630.1 Inhibitor of aspartate phosphatase RapH [Bacillus subtilis]QYX44195.1 phosphatase RapH inhibitor [Bacillus inaquosorum]